MIRQVIRLSVALALAMLLTIPVAAADSERSSVRFIPQSITVSSAEGPVFDDAFLDEFSSDPGEMSTRKAVLYSLLMPGLGDYHSGNRTRAFVFFGVEAAIWTSFIVSRVQGAQREDSYEEYAVRFAGVSRTGHSDDFYVAIREYDSSVGYEKFIKSEGRLELLPPFDPNGEDFDLGKNALDQYFLENRVADFEPWEWQSFEKKVQYQEIRSASKNAYRRATFSIAAAGANRVVSALFAYTSSRRSALPGANASARRYHIDFSPPRPEYEAAVTLIRRF